MSTTTDPELVQKPTIGTVLGEQTPVDSKQQSVAPSAIPSRASSFKSARSIAVDSPPTGPRRTPIPAPLSTCRPAPQPALTSEQATKYAALLSTVSAWTVIPTTSARNAPSAAITDAERMWLTRECLLRYLRATKWSPTEAPKRLLATLTWRREYQLDTFTPEYISPENETGKQIILGYDNDARPCLYLNPGKQNTKKSERQIQHLVFMLERVVEMMGPGQETTALLINFKESSSGSAPSVGQGRQTLTILQGHYPERLGRALISELPWYITTFFRLISPFIDPVTKSKMKFNEPLSNHVPSSQLWSQYGGKLDFEYDHATYWPALWKTCQERVAAYKSRWERAGKKVGEFEEYLRGGEQPSVEGVMNETPVAMVNGLGGGKDLNGMVAGMGNLKVGE
ncbi:hypothetical protein LTR04_006822 [Oleoguttula sp. CCFEE 6159]|nr:hypothetical protein LTR04_006822 [Oleoguttula sp. CCFEE 6159]